MITLQEFKSRILHPLLEGEIPAEQESFTLFAAEIEYPERYLYESEHWDEVIGAGRGLTRAAEKMLTVFAADGYTPADMLHANGLSWFILVHDRKVADRWSDSLQRTLANETDIVTLAAVTYPITIAQLTGGLYRSPTAIIGVPGVHDYQERINRYYGITTPTVVPRGESISARRHFGEVTAFMRGRLASARESRQLVPFYDSLAFCERCDSCKVRPAERLTEGSSPICGVCWHKRTMGREFSLKTIDLVWIEAVNFAGLIEIQRIPAAYHRFYAEIDEILRLVIPNTAITLLNGEGHVVFLAENGLEAATTALEDIRYHYENHPVMPFIAAVAGDGKDGKASPPRGLFDLAMKSAALGRQGDGFTVDSRRISEPFDRFRKPFSLEEARRRCQSSS